MQRNMWSILSSFGVTSWLVFILAFLIAYKWMNKSSLRLPPGPLSVPIVGTLPFMSGDIRDVFRKFAQKYGNIFTIYIGMERVIVVNGYEEVKSNLTNKIFDDKHTMWLDLVTDSKNIGLAQSSGHGWKEHRRYVLHTLRDFGLGKNTMEAIIADETQNLLGKLRECGDVCHNIQHCLKIFSFNVISGVLSGRRYQYGDAKIIQLLGTIDKLVKVSSAGNPALLFKVLRKLPGDIFSYHKGKHYVKEIQQFCQDWVDDHKTQLTRGNKPCDVITSYLTDMEQGEHSTFSEEQLVQTLWDMVVAGTDTTSTTLGWAFLYMIRYPDQQDKVQAEIDSVTEVTGRAPTIQDMINMPYTEAVLTEVQRISDLTPMVPHAPSQDTTFHGYDVPKGTLMMINYNSVFQDPNIWPNPDQFNPSRFLDEEDRYQRKAELFPFSLGKRACLGEGLARMELFIVFTHILQQFTLSVYPAGSQPTLHGVLGGLIHPQKYDLSIQPRLLQNVE